jgi:hypothetical protein
MPEIFSFLILIYTLKKTQINEDGNDGDKQNENQI